MITRCIFTTDLDSVGVEDRLIGCITFMRLSRYNLCKQ